MFLRQVIFPSLNYTTLFVVGSFFSEVVGYPLCFPEVGVSICLLSTVSIYLEVSDDSWHFFCFHFSLCVSLEVVKRYFSMRKVS